MVHLNFFVHFVIRAIANERSETEKKVKEEILHFYQKKPSIRWESNPQPQDQEVDALPQRYNHCTASVEFSLKRFSTEIPFSQSCFETF